MTILKDNSEPTKSHNTTLPFAATVKATNPTTKANVIHLLHSGLSICQIASQLSLSIGTVSNIRSKHCPGLANPSGGRPPKLSASDIRHALHLFSSRKAENAVQVTQALRDVGGTSLSASTIRRHLKRAGLKAVIKKKKPLLTARHRKSRLELALGHRHWTVDDWKRAMFSDETGIDRLGSDGRR